MLYVTCFSREYVVLSVHIRKHLGDLRLDVSFQVDGCAITAVFGPSGAGKTTLINCIAGLLRPDEGRIECGGTPYFDARQGINLSPERRRVGYVFQDGRLFPHMSVRSNLLFGRRFRPGPVDGAATLEAVVDLLDIGPLLDRRPVTLSGGEKQRVALGRALLCRPAVLLMDEPLTALDPPRKAELMDYIARIPEVWSIPILYVTHSPEELIRLARHLLVLRHGAVAAFGPLDEVLADPAVAGLTPPTAFHLYPAGENHVHPLPA